MEKLQLSDTLTIYKTKLNLKKFKNDFLNDCYKKIEHQKNIKTDGYGYKHYMKNRLNKNNTYEISNSTEIRLINKLDVIVKNGIDFSEYIYKSEGNDWNIINSTCWINRVRSIEPVQDDFHSKNRDDRFHTHTDISKKAGDFYPNYTWVYYIQMPNVVRKDTDDAVLYFKSKDGNEFSILPEEDDLIIIPGDVPHLPMNAPLATNDRIVLAGNVGFEYVKNKKTLL
jgi:hypothetical protein